MSEPKLTDTVRRNFVQHVLKLINDDHNGYGYQVTGLDEFRESTVIVFESDRPIVIGSKDMYYGVRKLTVAISSEYIPHA